MIPIWTLEKDTSNTHLTPITLMMQDSVNNLERKQMPMTLWMQDYVRQKFKKNCT